jgi:predicted glycosyltransferase involved in capsule biosynthesis
MYIVIFLFIDIILMSIEVLEKKDKNIEQYIDPEHKVNIIKQGK